VRSQSPWGREGDEVLSKGTPLGTLIPSVDRRYTSYLAARSSHGNTTDNAIITRIMTGERGAVRAVDLGFLHPWPHDTPLGTRHPSKGLWERVEVPSSRTPLGTLLSSVHLKAPLHIWPHELRVGTPQRMSLERE